MNDLTIKQLAFILMLAYNRFDGGHDESQQYAFDDVKKSINIKDIHLIQAFDYGVAMGTIERKQLAYA